MAVAETFLLSMFYTYILRSKKLHIFYYGHTEKAKDFELYLKSGSGKAFAYKRLVSVALARDFSGDAEGVPKR